MLQRISEPVSVWLIFDHTSNRILPKRILWKKRIYEIKRMGLRHHFRVGRTLFHIFSVESEELFFRLSLNTDNLLWKLEEVSDGLPD